MNYVETIYSFEEFKTFAATKAPDDPLDMDDNLINNRCGCILIQFGKHLKLKPRNKYDYCGIYTLYGNGNYVDAMIAMIVNQGLKCDWKTWKQVHAAIKAVKD